MKFGDLKNRIHWYSDRFNAHFDFGDNYALFSKNEEYGWPKPWRHPDSAGIYAFLDSDINVVYIGKARRLGARLNHYFGYGKNEECILKDSRVTGICYNLFKST